LFSTAVVASIDTVIHSYTSSVNRLNKTTMMEYAEGEEGTVSITRMDPTDEDGPDPVGDGKSLQQVAADACKRIDVGAAVLPKPLFSPDVQDYDGSEELRDAAASIATHYSRVLDQEFNAIVVEHHLKWAPLCVSEPGPLPGEKASDRLGRYDFHHADSIVNWAMKHGKKVKGHVLVWSVTSPKFLEELDSAEVREQLRRHIFTIMGHYRGRIKVWDVVDEARFAGLIKPIPTPFYSTMTTRSKESVQRNRMAFTPC
jgi:Glycosyl hydrolase family 10